MLVIWERRHRLLDEAQLLWLIVALLLVAAAMVVALAGVPGPRHEQVLRAALAVEAVWGAAMLGQRWREERRDGR